MNWFVALIGIVLLAALAVAAFIFGVNIVVWNVQDIWDKGANFWNVFWIMLVAIVLVGGSSKASA